jgi:hypothetical protein
VGGRYILIRSLLSRIRAGKAIYAGRLTDHRVYLMPLRGLSQGQACPKLPNLI